jgi:hypothetical protein
MAELKDADHFCILRNSGWNNMSHADRPAGRLASAPVAGSAAQQRAKGTWAGGGVPDKHGGPANGDTEGRQGPGLECWPRLVGSADATG